MNDAWLIDETIREELSPEKKTSLQPLLKVLEDYRLSRQNEESFSLNPQHVEELHLKTISEFSGLTKESEALEKSILDLANTLPGNGQLSMLQALGEQGGKNIF